MADSSSKAGNVQDEPGQSFHNNKQGSFQRMLGLYPQKKAGRGALKSSDKPKIESFKHQKNDIYNGFNHIKYIYMSS